MVYSKQTAIELGCLISGNAFLLPKVYIYNLFITVGISKLSLYQGVDFVQKVAVVWN